MRLHLLSTMRDKWFSDHAVAIFALTFALAALLSDAAYAQDTCIKTVRWGNEAPYSMRDANGMLVGVQVETMREILSRMQCEAKFVELPWVRAEIQIREGELDILPGTLMNENLATIGRYSRPLHRSRNVLFASKDASATYRLNTLTDIVGTSFRLGVPPKVGYGKAYRVAFATPEFRERVQPISSRKGGWQMIAAKRIDGQIADEVSGLTEIRIAGIETAVVATPVVVSIEADMAVFSRKTINAEFVNRFNAAFQTMLDDGTLTEILRKYLPCEVSAKLLGCR